MPVAIVFIQGLFELAGCVGFLVGYFTDAWGMMVIGGCLMVLDDAIEMGTGILKPLFPIILAVALAIILTPWYVGIFWASAAFKVLGIPASIAKVFAPKQFVEQVQARGAEI